MPESYFEKRKRELGITGGGSSSPQSDFFAQRKMDLGLIPDTRPKLTPEQSFQQKFGMAPPPLDISKSSFMKSLPGKAAAANDDRMMQELNKMWEDDATGRNLPVVGPVLRGLDYIANNPVSNAIAEYTMPDAPFLGQPGTNVRETFLKEAGRKPSTGVAQDIGRIAAPFFVPGAQLGTGNQVADATELAITKLPKIGNVGRSVITNATTGGLTGAGAEFAQGEGNLKDAAIQGAFGTGLGALSGAAVPLVGAGIKRGAEAIKKGSDDLPTLGINPFARKGGGFKNPNDTRSQIVSKTKGESTPFIDKVRSFYDKTIDTLQPINRFDKQVENVTGKTLKPSERSYVLALNSKGSDMIAKHILTERAVDSQGNMIGQSLKDIAKQIPKGRTLDFEDYLINKHAVTRMQRGEKVFSDAAKMTPEKSAAKAAEYEAKFPEFKQIADQYYKFNDDIAQKWLVDTGILSQEQYNAMKEANPFYVPNKRQFSELEKVNPQNKAKGGFGNQSNPIKKAVGSQRKIISPLESTIEHIDQYVKTAKRNEVMQTLIKNIEKDPEAFNGFAEIVKQPEKLDDITKKMMDGDGIEEVLQRFNENFDHSMKKPDLKNGNILRAFVNGEPVHVKVNDPQLLKALTGMEPHAQNAVVKWVGQATRMMKVLTTGANPVFSLTRNIFRDIPTAYINSKTTSNPITFAKDLVHSALSVMGNGELYKSFKAVGGGHSSSIAADRNLLAQSKRAILPQNNKVGLIAKGFNALENLNNAIESAPRLAEFKRAAKQGDKVRGLYEANDVTVNFNRSGQLGKELDAFFPYMNAALQGLDKFARAYKDNPAKATAKSIAAVTIPTMVLYAYNHNNPDYQKLSNYVKDNFFLIPKGDGTFWKIPKSREIGVPFGSAVERVLRQWWDKEPDAQKDFMNTVKTAFLPPLIGSLAEGKNPLNDTVFGPIHQLSTNKNFAGGSIVPGDLQKLSKPLQYDSQTSDVSKKIGELTGQSPKQIDFLIKSYGGVIGQLGIPATTQGGSIKDTLLKQVTADPTYSNDIMRDFYDMKDKLDKAQEDYKATGEKPADYDNTMRLRLDRMSNGTGADDISKIRKQIKQVQSSNISKEEKQAKIKELTDRINAIALRAMQK